MAQKPPTPGPAVADPDVNRPLLNSFALVKKDGKYHAIVLETRGTKVLREKVLESDDMRAVALDAVDKAAREWWLHGSDPFWERSK